MFNYDNLNDVEFEQLCKDVLERMLSTELRVFAKGRDGGIDLTDSPLKHNIIVQVKHYVKSKFANLRTTLKSELVKVKKLNPNHYYLCCGMKLTADNINEIYDIFSDYMESDKNIITLLEIDEFLKKDENVDIVRKHYKLWLYSSGILSQIYNQNIFVDCEALFGDIEDESKYFVATTIYSKCISCLDKHGVLMLTGHPGVGKTITSKMLTLYYASKGYTVRYTTNGDISDIKRSLSLDPAAKEVVLLDDCLGQHYFSMKEKQENELTALINYIKMRKSKKLILNSRITILNEAREKHESFGLFFKKKKIDEFIINMDDISPLEKAKIFYNHIVYKRIPTEYYANIKDNKNYAKIIRHQNYTPRIIEYVTLSSNYLEIVPEQYTDYILSKLNNPTDIWKNEYDRRFQDIDRVFLNTLYSLTDTHIEEHVVKRCFEKRLSNMINIDYTLNNFEMVLARLNQSVVKIIESKGKSRIGVINPSVNDFLKQVFLNNPLEVEKIRKSICHYSQLCRCYSETELETVISGILKDGTILNINFTNRTQKYYFIVSHICTKEILDKKYKSTIELYLRNAYGISNFAKLMNHPDVLSTLLSEPYATYYNLDFNEDLTEAVLHGCWDLSELVFTINVLKSHEVNYDKLYKEVLTYEVSDYVENIDISEYCESHDVGKLMQENYTYGGGVETESVVKILSEYVNEDVFQEICEQLYDLEDTSLSEKLDFTGITVDISKIEEFVNSYSMDDPDDLYDEYRERNHGSSWKSCVDEIDAIFDR